MFASSHVSGALWIGSSSFQNGNATSFHIVNHTDLVLFLLLLFLFLVVPGPTDKSQSGQYRPWKSIKYQTLQGFRD